MNLLSDWALLGFLAPQSELASLPWFAWAVWGGVFALVFPGIVAYMVWGERKAAARFQDRIGPNRVGPLGLLQPIADFLKLVTKENIVPRSADWLVHIAAPVILLISAFLVLAVIPFGISGESDRAYNGYPGLVAVDLPSGLLYLIAVSGLSPIGIFLAGWSSRNKYSLLGAMRAVAQLVSYEIPQVLATVPVILWTGSLSLVAIMNRQIDVGWFLFSPPGLMAFTLLTIANVAEVNRTPFDLPEAESEIIAGYHTEYSGMRFGLFFLAEYMSVFGVSCLGTVLFLGGGTIPFIDVPSLAGSTTASLVLVNAIMISVFAVKVLGYVFLMFWIRATLPRMRVDRLMNFAWKVMVPLSVVNILIAAIWYEMVYRNPRHSYVFGLVDLTALYGWAVTLPIAAVAVWFVFWIGLRTGKLGTPRIMPSPTAHPQTLAAR